MPVTAYVLIQTEVGKAAEVARAVGQLRGFVSAEAVAGVYDVIVRAEADSMDELARVVVADVGQIEGITRTLTCTVVHLD